MRDRMMQKHHEAPMVYLTMLHYCIVHIRDEYGGHFGSPIL